jgi:hypothetical protein
MQKSEDGFLSCKEIFIDTNDEFTCLAEVVLKIKEDIPREKAYDIIEGIAIKLKLAILAHNPDTVCCDCGKIFAADDFIHACKPCRYRHDKAWESIFRK